MVEIRENLVNSTGITISNAGVISIGQSINTTDSPEFDSFLSGTITGAIHL